MRNLAFIVMLALELAGIVFCLIRKFNHRWLWILALVVVLCLTAFWWFRPSYKLGAPTGDFTPASLDMTLEDENRLETYKNDGSNRTLNVTVWYPENYSGAEHTCPLVLFSHGSFGSRSSNVSLYRELASHGYVVCSIDHAFQCLDNMDKSYSQGINAVSDKTREKREESLGYFKQWMDIRMGDIEFVLDELTGSANLGADAVTSLIDPARIGLMGHSLGGSAVLGVGRERKGIGAVIALESPFMRDATGATDDGYTWVEEPYPAPLLSVYSDSAWVHLSQWKQYGQNWRILNDDDADTFDIHAVGTGHMTLTDLAYSMPPLCLIFGQNMFLDVNAMVSELNGEYLAFFDCYLKQSGEYSPKM